MKQLKWAVLGTGVIANEMAQALQKQGKSLYSVGNRTYEKAVAFGEQYGISKVYTDFQQIFTDPEVDAIYITTPHNTHREFMEMAIENGKHILVEKSITLNSKELDEMIRLADKKGVVIAEAMTIYHMPIYQKLKEIIQSGKIGKVNLITMNFGSLKEYLNIEQLKNNIVIEWSSLYSSEAEKYVVFSVFDSSMLEENKNYFDLRRFDEIDLDGTKKFIEEIRERSLYDIPVDVTAEDQIMVLVTCSYKHEDGRLLIFCRKARRAEDVNTLLESMDSIVKNN